jgi:hypothetical protein
MHRRGSFGRGTGLASWCCSISSAAVPLFTGKPLRGRSLSDLQRYADGLIGARHPWPPAQEARRADRGALKKRKFLYAKPISAPRSG